MNIGNFFKNLFSENAEEEVSLRIGESVKAKKGTKNPQNPKFSISGWQGRVVSFESMPDQTEISVGIQWDSETLRNIPENDIVFAFENGLDYTGIFLPMSQLEKADPRDTLQDIEKVIAELTMRYRWAELGAEGKRIKNVLNNVDERDIWACFEAWEIYLKKRLVLPMEALYIEDDNSQIAQNETLTITEFEEMDDLQGLMVSVKYKSRKLQIPLADLAGVEPSEATEALKDYALWFENY